MYKHRVAFKAQSFTYTAVMPLLSVLDSMDPKDTESRNKISTAIQLICTANLQINRFRRSMISPLLKKDMRKSLLSHPIRHDNLFGQDFEKCAEQAITEQSAKTKIMHHNKFQNFSSQTTSSGRTQRRSQPPSPKYHNNFRM